jgi:hypothetical protein
VHSGAYLTKEVIKTIYFFNITHSIVAITHDNASVNDVLLQEFQDIALEKWKALGDEEQYRKWLQFTLEEGDIRCVSHIYNLGVIAGIALSPVFCSLDLLQFMQLLFSTLTSVGLRELKAEPTEHRHEYYLWAVPVIMKCFWAVIVICRYKKGHPFLF